MVSEHFASENIGNVKSDPENKFENYIGFSIQIYFSSLVETFLRYFWDDREFIDNNKLFVLYQVISWI